MIRTYYVGTTTEQSSLPNWIVDIDSKWITLECYLANKHHAQILHIHTATSSSDISGI